MTEYVTVNHRIPADDLWSSIMGSAWETWSWWTAVEYQGKADWDVPGYVKITAWDGVHEDYDHLTTKVLNPDDLFEAYNWYVNQGYKMMYEDLDAVYGDVIVQRAFYGEVIYG